MKISVELSSAEMRDVMRYTGERRKGPAIRQLVKEALMLRRRAATAEKFMSGEWSAELKGFQTFSRVAGRVSSSERLSAGKGFAKK